MPEQLWDIVRPDQLWSAVRIVVVVVLPLLSVAFFVAGIALRGRCPVWLLVAACIVPVGYGLLAVFSLYKDGIDWWTLAGMLMAIALGLLIWAMPAARRGRSYRRLSSLLGLTMPLAVVAYTIYLWVSAG